jgi:hypothetical protein
MISKSFLTACFLLIIVSSSFSQITRFIYTDSLHTVGLTPNSQEVVKRNKLHKAVIYRLELEGNKVKDSFAYRAFYYDTAGRIAIEQMLSKAGAIGTVDTFTYNSTGSLIKIAMYSMGRVFLEDYRESGITKDYSVEGVVRIDTSSNSYNEKGQLVKHVYMNYKHGFSYLYYYNNDGRPERIEYYDMNGKKISTSFYKYKAHRKSSQVIICREDNNGRRKIIECIYNNLSQCKACNQYLSNKISLEEKFNYNKDGTLFEHITIDANNRKTLERYHYSIY